MHVHEQLDWVSVLHTGVLINLRQRWNLQCTQHLLVCEWVDGTDMCDANLLNNMCEWWNVQRTEYMLVY